MINAVDLTAETQALDEPECDQQQRGGHANG
jgi:hypothetical protein